jgi:predicted PurR-regulated permease PerM
MDGLVMGAAAGAGLWALGVNYPLLLGALTGIANVVPYLGPILGGGAAMLMALVQFKSAGAMAKVLVLYVSIKLLDDVLVQPITIGKSVHLHPMLLLASVIAGGHALGLIGMIFAVPAVTVLQEVSRILLERRRYHGAPAMDRHHRVPTQPYVC